MCLGGLRDLKDAQKFRGRELQTVGPASAPAWEKPAFGPAGRPL